MTDVTPETQRRELPPCPFSVHCERLLEDLDKNSPSLQDSQFLFADDDQDRQLLAQVRKHLPECPTCMVVLTHARAQRFWLRQQLLLLLGENEQKVPSSTARIMQALAHEPAIRPEALPSKNGHKKLLLEAAEEAPITLPAVTMQRQRSLQRSRGLLQNILAFVAVLVVIFASFNLFSHMLSFHLASSSGTSGVSQINPTVAPVIRAKTWSSVIIAMRNGVQKIITSTDPMTGKSVVLASSRYPDTTMIDGVSHDGYQVLYHDFDGSRTRYYLLPSAQNSLLYTVVGKGGQAIWSTDDSSIFIGTPEGVEKIDVHSHNATLALSSITAPDLRFYRDGYLYFVASTSTSDGASTWLNRVDLMKGNISSITEEACPFSYDFWLSPDGSKVYYRCDGKEALYAITIDGTGSYVLRPDAGPIIGYTAQGEPLTLLQTKTAFQVVKLGGDEQHDQTVVADIAPGASDLT
ncbi:MAG: hypothetical protein JO215_00725, partial [Ktedonobacteraceae bacterium]|nr:hypothetical protein [Ktedonobacteraceae bacterium]